MAKPLRPPRGTSWRGAMSSGSQLSCAGSAARLTSASSYGSIRGHEPAARPHPRRHPPREPPQLPAEGGARLRRPTGTRYPEMDDRVNRLANALLADGVGHGDRILWLGQNCHRVLEGLLAAAKIGARLLSGELAPDRRGADVRHRRRRRARRHLAGGGDRRRRAGGARQRDVEGPVAAARRRRRRQLRGVSRRAARPTTRASTSTRPTRC